MHGYLLDQIYELFILFFSKETFATKFLIITRQDTNNLSRGPQDGVIYTEEKGTET